jgi:hypothetical protein
MKNIALVLGAVAVATVLSGCETTADRMAALKPKAVQAAETRGRFEMSCPAATGTVLAEQDVPPAINVGRFRGPDRLVFTVGMTGCDKRMTYVVVCPDDGSNNCFAAEGHR